MKETSSESSRRKSIESIQISSEKLFQDEEDDEIDEIETIADRWKRLVAEKMKSAENIRSLLKNVKIEKTPIRENFDVSMNKLVDSIDW